MKSLVIRALGLPRSLALNHKKKFIYFLMNSINTKRGNNPKGHPAGTNKEKNFNPCSLNPSTVAPNTTVKLSENVNIK